MARQSYRLLLAAASLVIAVAGTFFVVLGNTERAAANSSFVIEANEFGFNPPVCQMNRDDYFAWKNVGKSVRRIIVPTAGVNSPPLWDTGDILPGETSAKFELTHGTTIHYEDFYDPSLKGTLQTPLYSNSGPVNCSPQAPTPTPTPPPAPTPVPKPPRCITSPGCAVAPALSRDEQ